MTVVDFFTGLPRPPAVIMAANPDEIPPPLPVLSGEDFDEFGTAVEAFTPNELSWPQYHFVTSGWRFPAMIAGYGAGKTEAGIIRALRLKFDYPNQNVGYYLPTYGLIKSIVFPRIEELLTKAGYRYFLNETDKELTIYGMKGRMIFRTMDSPELIIGYEHADAVVDELDTLKTDKAAEVWRKIIARNRQKKPDGSLNTVAVATTPEGFKFVYEKWKRKPLKGSQIIKASTHSNAKNLPVDYIDTLRDNYPSAMLDAYIEGEFVNLTQGCVYPDFDRALNKAPLGVGIKPGETLHIGVDFNVGTMAAVVHIIRDDEPIAVDEFVGFLDTPALITAIQARYQTPEMKAAGLAHRIMAYPDASGKNRKSNNAAQTDIALMRQAGFFVLAKASNPFVRDRVAAVNKQIHKDGKRRYRVNVDSCPHLVEGLEKQAYNKNGEPDKTSGFDHVMDAAGYFIAYRYPIVHGKAIQTNLKGT